MHVKYYTILGIFLLLFSGCKETKREVAKENLEGEYITRRENEILCQPPPPLERAKRTYPWEGRWNGVLPLITKDFFQCKGSTLNPIISDVKEGGNKVYIRDCMGGEKHGLPLREGKEFIYPCLIDLLNYVQQKSQKKVIITCGHRCPLHNTYADKSIANKSSKHMLGAEVDFYIEGLENQPEKVVEWIQAYYEEKSALYEGDKEYLLFGRLDPTKFEITTPPWANKEIIVKLYLPAEGRDFDNNHSYPYLSLQVRYDRKSKSKVAFDEKLSRNFLRR